MCECKKVKEHKKRIKTNDNKGEKEKMKKKKWRKILEQKNSKKC